MDLKSLEFLAFALVFLIIYYLFQKTSLQKWIILAGDVFFVLVSSGLASLVVVCLLCGIVWKCALETGRSRKTDKKRAAVFKYIGIAAALSSLLYFKFFTGTFEALGQLLTGGHSSLWDFAAPIGMSYYALSLCAYVLDTAHGKIQAETNYLNLLSFTLFFPALVEGPFNLYKNLMPQLTAKHVFEGRRVILGMQRMLWGYFQKAVLADRIGIIVNGILKDQTAHGMLLFWCMVLYSFQIYTDFAGGIDVIMGLSECMGIILPENFRSPLISRSVTEYWQRWHMTLGTIMEKYLYYPLVLSKWMRSLSKKIKNKYLSRVFSATLATFLVFIVVGIWHGTGWNYVAYGLYQAFFTSMAILCKPVYQWLKTKLHIQEDAASWKIFTIMRTFTILVFGRFLIKAADLPQALSLIRRTLSGPLNFHVIFDGNLLNYGLELSDLIIVYAGIMLLFFVDIKHEQGVRFRDELMKKDIVFRYAVYLFAVFFIMIYGIFDSGMSFIYAQY